MCVIWEIIWPIFCAGTPFFASKPASSFYRGTWEWSSADVTAGRLNALFHIRTRNYAALICRFDRCLAVNSALGELIDVNTCHVPQGVFYLDFTFKKGTGIRASRFSLECQTLLVNDFERPAQAVDRLKQVFIFGVDRFRIDLIRGNLPNEFLQAGLHFRELIIVDLRRGQLPFEDVGRKFDHSRLGCLRWSSLSSIASLAPTFEKFAGLTVKEFHAFGESDTSDGGKSDGNTFRHTPLDRFETLVSLK